MHSSLPTPYQAQSLSENSVSGAPASRSAHNALSGARPNKPANLSLGRAGRSATRLATFASSNEESFELDVLIPTPNGWRRPVIRISSDWESGCIRDVAISFSR